MDINVITSSSRFLHCAVTYLSSNVEHYFTFVYAYPQKHLQSGLWEDILLLNPTVKPWCLMGDFNIMDISEMNGGCQVTITFLNKFLQFLNNGNLLSLNAFGLPFTWSCLGQFILVK